MRSKYIYFEVLLPTNCGGLRRTIYQSFSRITLSLVDPFGCPIYISVTSQATDNNNRSKQLSFLILKETGFLNYVQSLSLSLCLFRVSENFLAVAK